MQRYFFFALAIAFFVYLVQAAPEKDADSVSNKLEEELSKVIETFQNNFNNLQNDPKLQDFLRVGQAFFQNATAQVKEQAEKIMPQLAGATA